MTFKSESSRRWWLSWLTAALLALNWKNIPGVFSGRFMVTIGLDYYYRRYKILRDQKRGIKPMQTEASRVITWRPQPALLSDIDMNMHKNNATYSSDLDLARAKSVVELFTPYLVNHPGTFIPLASLEIKFKREIKPFAPYHIETHIAAYDRKFLCFVSKFILDGKRDKSGKPVIAAEALSTYVFKSGRKTIPPSSVLRESGFAEDDHVRLYVEDVSNMKWMTNTTTLSERSTLESHLGV